VEKTRAERNLSIFAQRGGNGQAVRRGGWSGQEMGKEVHRSKKKKKGSKNIAIMCRLAGKRRSADDQDGEKKSPMLKKMCIHGGNNKSPVND